jgi:exodeoxyribonuclease-3
VQHVTWPRGYEPYWNAAVKKGYSGTVTFTKRKPLSVVLGIGLPNHDGEGRVVTTEFADFYLINVYQPNSQRGLTRLDYRVKEWDPAFLAYIRRLDKKKPVVFCGDLNVAHTEIDLANPKTNRRNAGFTEEERTSFSALLASGFVDTFREFEKGPGHYTWWSQMGDCRARNIGWRVDYFVASERLRPVLKGAFIQPKVFGSDHCPVGLELK